ncbi:uncharacterized protein CDAR_262301 [Caerostris darwini]|uniref:Uncharacterized protein n=1 Tax=Caerostris darwini TaxID=1538125 RepID=A0AAV4QE29_9ARAC|nr:uncharacterized protein CDAR_262301 [Caerostris darwini]
MASNPPGFMKPPHVPFLSSKMSEKGKLFKLQLRRRHTSGIEERPSRSKERLGEFFLFLTRCNVEIKSCSRDREVPIHCRENDVQRVLRPSGVFVIILDKFSYLAIYFGY